ncbi:low affinity immunoglobulin epsilon Fc receptor-like [Ptychodera flava]|uniref:low affinity immunoglobulin epsilon Fc receptor-like n=1 Tax=Ptychodera flava TaxID=63121 RepID=UPI00396A88DD
MRVFVITTLLVLAVLSACFAAPEPKAESSIDEAFAVEEIPEIASEAEFEDSEDDLEERSFEEDDMEEFDESDLDERSVEEEDVKDVDTAGQNKCSVQEEEVEAESADLGETAEEEVDEEAEEEEVDMHQMSAANDETEESSEDVDEEALVKDAHKRWVCRHRRCYRVFTARLNWCTAQRVCRRHRGTLVSIHNHRQNCIVRAYARRYGNLWIGLNDIRVEGRFKWINRAPYNYRRWSRGEPNNYKNEDCVEMYRNGHWNDLKCAHRRRFMCMRRRHFRRPKPCWG